MLFPKYLRNPSIFECPRAKAVIVWPFNCQGSMEQIWVAFSSKGRESQDNFGFALANSSMLGCLRYGGNGMGWILSAF